MERLSISLLSLPCRLPLRTGFIRHAALQLLGENWPDDEKTQKMFYQYASLNGEAASWHGGKYSRFGEIIFYEDPTVDLWGAAYLDPSQPIPTEHIQKAAKKAGIPPDKIDETVRSLSAHMGWDITKGSEAGKLA